MRTGVVVRDSYQKCKLPLSAQKRHLVKMNDIKFGVLNGFASQNGVTID